MINNKFNLNFVKKIENKRIIVYLFGWSSKHWIGWCYEYSKYFNKLPAQKNTTTTTKSTANYIHMHIEMDVITKEL